MRRTVIYGAGGLGQLVRDILLHDRSAHTVGFLDSRRKEHGASVDGLPVFGGMECVERLRWDGVERAIVAIGDNRERVRVARLLLDRGLQLCGAIHPLASVAQSARIGRHIIIGAQSRVCVHARVGEHCVLSAGSIVEHDNVIEDGCFLHPAVRLAGGVRVGAGSVFGIGSTAIPYRTLGKNVRVAPGAIVVRDVEDGTTVSGNPARPVASDARDVIQSVST